jgi:phage gp45-like
VATDNRNVRVVSLQSGETAIYTDDGTYIKLKKAGEVEVKAATLLTIDVPDTLIKGKLTVEDDVLIKGKTVMEDELTVEENATFEKDAAVLLNLTVGGNVAVTGVVGAAGFTGPGGGTAMLSVDLQTTGEITAANVTGGGTDLASVKSVFNAHTHVETGGTTNPTGAPL